ncbi:cytochrome c biogenesis protein Ccs1 [Chloropicon primus]|uniref:Cytochrome c biogenesis protein Ccs1 n=2 Tax=Chloropicon primus TaxID=1764295 RepID=A0A5B8MRI8_9CHLO|nr:cytochrome c biogenesis protein Ccs1 [Chloropicon primus]UPR02239.1 cytochrome c biogenesis protein Ccs1 [Chloropicon primus]|eukprot:QDZ23021.1 cytochrome c biogenesis protein Ccs1 [Chloropicon primus]
MERNLARGKLDGGVSVSSEEEGEPRAQTLTVEVGGTEKGGFVKERTGSSRRILFRRVVRRLAKLNFAIGEIAFLALLSALGTAVEQNKAPEYYTSQLIDGHPLLSDILGNLVLLFGFDHMYSSPVYLGMCALLTASLMACSYQTQWPMVKVAQRWRFIEDPDRVMKLSSSGLRAYAVRASRPGGKGKGSTMRKVSSVLGDRGYETFVKPKEDGTGEVLYAFKGLSGKFAPIGVHISMVLVVLGASISTTCGWHGTLMIDEGEEMPVKEAFRPNSFLASATNEPWKSRESGKDVYLKLNKFKIDYYPDGKVEQFYSDLSVTEDAPPSPYASLLGSYKRPTEETFQKLISVNNPLRFGALTAYQTDWAVSGVRVEVTAGEASEPSRVFVPMVSLEGKLGEVGGRIWGGVLPVQGDDGEDDDGEGGGDGVTNFTIVARDLQNVGVYGPDGKFLGIRRPGSGRKLGVGGITLKVIELSSSSGLELKSDPGVPVVYTGFAFLMLTTVLSYVSHSQVWAHLAWESEGEDGRRAREGDLVIGGTTNRAKREFQNEVDQVVKDIQAKMMMSRRTSR